MKQLTLIGAVEELSLLPVDASVQIYWEPQTGFMYILDTKEKAGVPASAKLIASGNPGHVIRFIRMTRDKTVMI